MFPLHNRIFGEEGIYYGFYGDTEVGTRGFELYLNIGSQGAHNLIDCKCCSLLCFILNISVPYRLRKSLKYPFMNQGFGRFESVLWLPT